MEAVYQTAAVGIPLITGLILYERRLTKIETIVERIDKTLTKHVEGMESTDAK